MLVGSLLPDQRNVAKFGFVNARARKRTDILRSMGCDVLELRRDDPDFFSHMAELKAARDAVLFLNYQFNTALHARQSAPHYLADMLEVPSFGLISDHPFSHFMIKDVLHGPERIRYLGRDAGYGDVLASIRPDLSYATVPGIPLVERVPDDTRSENKSIDVLIAMDLREDLPSRDEFISHFDMLNFTDGKAFGLTLFDRLMSDWKTYPWTIFQDLLREVSGRSFEAIVQSSDRVTQNKRKVVLCKALGGLDLMVRARRRRSILKAVEGVSDTLKIVSLAARPSGAVPDGIDWVGNVDQAEYFRVLAHSKTTLFSHPTFTGMVNNRVVNAISSRCSVICDENPALRTALGDNRAVHFLDKTDRPAARIEQAVDEHEVAIDHAVTDLDKILETGSHEAELIGVFERTLNSP